MPPTKLLSLSPTGTPTRTAIPGSNSFVYRQGGVAGGNVFTSFASAYAAAIASGVLGEIVVDDSNGVPIVTPGAYDLSQIDLTAYASTGYPVELTLPTGVTFTGMRQTREYLTLKSTSNAPIFTVSGTSLVRFFEAFIDTSGATAAFFKVLGTGFLALFLESGSALLPGGPIVDTDDNAYVLGIAYASVVTGANAFTGTGTVDLYSYSAANTLNPTQAIVAPGAYTVYEQTNASKVVYGSSTVKAQLDATPQVKMQTATFSLAQLQVLGGVLVSTQNIGAALPANARLLGAEIEITQAFAGVGLVSAVGSVQASTDAAGSIVTAAALTVAALVGYQGLARYLSRGGQQIQALLTLVGVNFNALTAGALSVRLFYTVIAP